MSNLSLSKEEAQKNNVDKKSVNELKKKYVYIGRFQLPHIGHEALIRHGIVNADELILLVGSANLPRSEKNPFSFEERRDMLDQICQRFKTTEGRSLSIQILPLNDFNDNDRWVQEVEKLVDKQDNEEIVLLGCKKDGDASTFYLDLFPNWDQDFIEEVSFPGIDVISSTKLRKLFFDKLPLPDAVSDTVKKYLSRYGEFTVNATM